MRKKKTKDTFKGMPPITHQSIHEILQSGFKVNKILTSRIERLEKIVSFLIVNHKRSLISRIKGWLFRRKKKAK